ncbi:MAG TPA: hypothetical protein DCX67_02325, partial [Opitutae bacterium]|nr:hypothetical protein [Opitutae bacterium]
MKWILTCLILSFLIQYGLPGKELNLATPDKYPYADLKGGRESYSLAKEKVNEARLYEFYARQADYYMANPDEIPEVIPSYPGLDGAVHGHWGKNNQNNHNDGRWNDGDQGEHFTHVVKGKGFNVLKGICVKLGDGHVLSTCFDPQSLSYRVVWNGWIRFEPHRWGTSRNANVDEKPWFALAKAEMPDAGEYLGLRRFGKRVVFEYRIGRVRVEDEPWATKDAFYRRIDLRDAGKKLSLPCPVMDGSLKVRVVESKGVTSTRWAEGELEIEGAKMNARLIIRVSKERKPAGEAAALAHLKAERKIEKRWKEVLKV